MIKVEFAYLDERQKKEVVNWVTGVGNELAINHVKARVCKLEEEMVTRLTENDADYKETITAILRYKSFLDVLEELIKDRDKLCEAKLSY